MYIVNVVIVVTGRTYYLSVVVCALISTINVVIVVTGRTYYLSVVVCALISTISSLSFTMVYGSVC